MSRTVKHFNLHRINGTELRVISDVETGVLPIIQEEEAVIRGYQEHLSWPHRLVSLFILQDLQPLARQLGANAGMLPGGAANLDQRPVLQVYDLLDLASCHVFVNQGAMVQADYWDDTQSIRGVLAHEHAHPLSENQTTHSSRQVTMTLDPIDPASDTQPDAAIRQQRRWELLQEVVEKLCRSAPREIFANDTTIAGGFAAPLLHINMRNLANLQRGLAGRDHLRQHLLNEVAQGTLAAHEVAQVMLIGDMRSYLDIAMEVAPFYRSGLHLQAHHMESILETDIFPSLEPAIHNTYTRLMKPYCTIRTDMQPDDMVAWCLDVAHILTDCLAQKELTFQASAHLSGT